MRRALALTLLVLAAACSSTNESAGPGDRVADGGATAAPRASAGETSASTTSSAGAGRSSGSASAGGATSPLPGQSAARAANTRPIKVGFLFAVNDAAADAGIDNGDTFTPEDVVHGFVRSYNTSGGLAGRKIEPVYASLNSSSNDYAAQLQSACSSFTEDDHVSLVFSTVGYYAETLLACTARAKIPLITGDWVGPDAQDAKRYPHFVTPAALVGDVRMSAVVRHLTRSGFMRPASRIGVVVEDCAFNRRVYANGLVPALKRAGMSVASRFDTRCFRSIGDYAAQTSQMSNAVLRFRQLDVDRVMVVSQGAEANLLYAFSTVAQAQGWRPGYAVSSTALPEALALNMSKDQLANVRGVGWLPVLDTEDLQQAAPSATGRRCLDRMAKVGIRPGSNTDLANVYAICETFALSASMLGTTYGDPSVAALTDAIASVGSRYISAFTLGGKMTLSGGRLRAASGRLFAYKGGRFVYTSDAFVL